MDAFAGGMTARGPTLGPDRETWTGSMHIVDLPSADAAREFVEREPYHRAGLYEHHLIRGFRNRLGRTMWDFQRDSDDPLFLVITPHVAVPHTARLIVHGELLEDASPAGAVVALQASGRAAVDALFPRAEIHDWEFGGRR